MKTATSPMLRLVGTERDLRIKAEAETQAERQKRAAVEIDLGKAQQKIDDLTARLMTVSADLVKATQGLETATQTILTERTARAKAEGELAGVKAGIKPEKEEKEKEPTAFEVRRDGAGNITKIIPVPK